MNNLFITKQNTLVFGIYLGGMMSYNIFTIYSNGSEQLLEYRKTKQTFKNETEAIVTGTQKNLIDNLLLSLFWPIRLPLQIIPMLILNLNTKADETKIKESINVEEVNTEPKKNEINEKSFNFNEEIILSFDFSLVNKN